MKSQYVNFLYILKNNQNNICSKKSKIHKIKKNILTSKTEKGEKSKQYLL